MKKLFIVIFSLMLVLAGCSAQPEGGEGAAADEPVRSVWLTYFELEEFTSSNETAADFEEAIKSAFKRIADIGLNTVTVQVRPCADAFYDSDYFPVSKYCFGAQGSKLKYDPLLIMTEAAHKQGLRIEAWINPYRASQNNNINELCRMNPAKVWYLDDSTKNRVYISDKIYFNPACPEVTELIVNGVGEIVENYDIDGIHFDDYFYPCTEKEIDAAEYSLYLESGGELSLGDWRRENVSQMVRSVYSKIKSIDSQVSFGISPQSNVRTNRDELYADVERWVSEEGFVDYICPQIYFGFYNEVQPFTRTVKEWVERTKTAKLCIGLPLYKAGNEDEFASPDSDYAINEFVDNNNVISRQIVYLKELQSTQGFYIYSFSFLTDEEDTPAKRETQNIMQVL